MLAAEAARHSCLRSFVSTATSSEMKCFWEWKRHEVNEEDTKRSKTSSEALSHRQQLCFGKWTWEAVVAARLETMPPAEASSKSQVP